MRSVAPRQDWVHVPFHPGAPVQSLVTWVKTLTLSSPRQVSEVISSIRQVSKSALKADAKPKQETDEAFYNSQKYEVLYCGKVRGTLHCRLLRIALGEIGPFQRESAEEDTTTQKKITLCFLPPYVEECCKHVTLIEGAIWITIYIILYLVLSNN